MKNAARGAYPKHVAVYILQQKKCCKNSAANSNRFEFAAEFLQHFFA